MSRIADLTSRLSKTTPLQVLPPRRWAGQPPTYRDADSALIDAALRRSQRRPSGNWYAFAASDEVRTRPLGASVAGLELVAWRGEDGALHAGPGACPHLGADLSTGTIDCGALICPWHGLRLQTAGPNSVGDLTHLTTTACSSGCAWMTSAASRRPIVRYLRCARAAPSFTR